MKPKEISGSGMSVADAVAALLRPRTPITVICTAVKQQHYDISARVHTASPTRSTTSASTTPRQTELIIQRSVAIGAHCGLWHTSRTW